MTKNKVLIIAGEFLPNTESVGGVIRVFSFLKTLKNFKKYVVCKKSKFRGYFGLRKYLKNTKVIHVNRFISTKNNLMIRVIRFFFGNILYLYAIDSTFFLLSSYKTNILKILKEQNINKVIISGPPFSLFYLVPYIKLKFPDIKIILDYRDGWGKRITSGLYIFKFLQNKFEKKIITKSDFIVTATKKIFDDVKSFKISTNVIFLSNGYLKLKNLIHKKLNLDKKIINIGYFGLISDKKESYRDINILIKTIELFKNQKFNFYFFGNSKIDEKIKNKHFLNFYKNTSYLKTQSLMKQFDYLLILHTEKSTSSEVITGKFYEYLLSGVPILVISNGDTEAGKIIKKLKIGYQIDYSKKNLFDLLNRINKKFVFKKKFSVEKFSRDFQNKKLIKIMKNL